MTRNLKATNQTGKNRIIQYARQNWGTIIFAIIIAVLFVNPNAKVWLMRQLIDTGLFNPKLDNKPPSNLPSVDFEYRTSDGKIANTANLRGKVVFINFWASWCPPCRAEFPGIAALYEHFKDNPEVVFLLLDEDDNLQTGEQFLKKEQYHLPLVTRTGRVPEAIYNGTLPTTVILDKTGHLRLHHTGFAGYGNKSFVTQLTALAKE